ncbi:MAG: hypothetical protein ABIT08_04820 [Bacteroidia bacterium]
MIKKKIILFALTCAATVALLFSACKKDRVPVDDYQSMDSFYNQYKEEEQEFIIDSTGNCPLIAKKGTKICVSADLFMFTNGTGITYPFTLKVVELYSIKDMLLWRAPATSAGTILETSAEIRVRAFKNNTELVLKPGKTYYMEMDTMTNLQSNMQVYYGTESNNIIDWSNAASPVAVNSYFYTLYPGQMGWVSSARQHITGSQNTTITLTVPGTNTQNIEVFLSFDSFKGLMKITNLVSLSVPVGEQVTLLAFGKKQTNDFVLDEQHFSVTANQQVPLTMTVISETDLLAALAAL